MTVLDEGEEGEEERIWSPQHASSFGDGSRLPLAPFFTSRGTSVDSILCLTVHFCKEIQTDSHTAQTRATCRAF